MQTPQFKDSITFSPADTVGIPFVCPECGKNLIDKDLESFHACPYCNHKFQDTPAFQDFLDTRAIQEWTVIESQIPIVMKIEEESAAQSS